MKEEDIKTLQKSITVGQEDIRNKIFEIMDILKSLEKAQSIDEEMEAINKLDQMVKYIKEIKKQTEMAMRLYLSINDISILLTKISTQATFIYFSNNVTEFIRRYEDVLNKYKMDIVIRKMNGGK